MAISKRPRFKKDSWVRVQNPAHPFDQQVGRVAIGGSDSSEVDFFADDSPPVRKPLMNVWLSPASDPLKSAQG